MPIPIIFENNLFLVLDKPAGILSEDVLGEFPSIPRLTHRLDKDTSGVMVLGKNEKEIQALQKLFLTRKVKKKYLALVHGVPKEDKGEITLPIVRGKGLKRIARLFTGKGRAALTAWKIKKSYQNFTLLAVSPKTGRTHQIRVHLKSLGYPIAGDKLYKFKRQKTPQGLNRQFLHSCELTFREFKFHSSLPKGLQNILDKLE